MSENKISEQEKCIFCGDNKNITREHAISDNLFPDNYEKNNLITVPSCRKCNESYSHDEELFRIFLVNQSTEKSQAAKDMLHTKITRAMKKAPGKAFNVLKKMFPVKINLPNGSQEDKVAFNISKEDWERYYRVLDKYVKALFYYHLGKTIPSEHEIKHVQIFDPSLIPDEIKSTLKWNLDHEHLYGYGYAVVPESLQSVWTFVFYDTVIFQSMAANPGELSGL
jgi:hypothetical protein